MAWELGTRWLELRGWALRYGKIFIMTDVDGSRIRVMLLMFFFRFHRELMEKGYLYIAQLPLCKFAMGSGRARTGKYTFLEEKKEEYLREILGINEGGAITDQDL